ncbi:MAG: glycosyltransferase family 39 protein [Candidatus Firestonebacteria bacterium]|nr:glycosyltransferase family 39 protein [Candidatus Firestonebacteria bacterium]
MKNNNIQKNTSFINIYIIILILILILGFIIQIYGINHGLSSHTNALWGEEDQLLRVFNFWKEWDFNPHWFLYPQFYLYIAFIMQGIVFLAGKIFGIYKDTADFTVQFVTNTQFFYLLARIGSVIFGVSTIYALYHTGKKYFNETAGLISAFFLSFSPLFVKYSHYYYPDVYVTLFVVLSFIPIYNIYKNGKTSAYVWGGILTGMGMGTKYFPVALIFEIILAHIFFIKQSGLSFKKIINKNIILCFFCIGIAYFLSTPYSVLSFSEVTNYLANKRNTIPGKWFGFENAYDSKIIHHITINLPPAIGIPLLLFGFTGIGYALFKRRKDCLLLILFLTSYFLMIEFGGGVHFANYMVTAVPFFLLFAAYILVEIVEKLKTSDLNKNFILLFAVILLSGNNIYACIKEGKYISNKESRIKGVEWIEANIVPGTRILGTTYSPPVLHYQKIREIMNDPAYNSKRKTIEEKFLSRPVYQLLILPWIPQYYNLKLYKKDFDYIMIDSGIYARHEAAPQTYPIQIKFYKDLEKECTLVKIIEGEPEYPGPTIKIYKINK